MIRRANVYMLLLILYMQLLRHVLVYFINSVSIHILQSVSLMLSFAVPFFLYFLYTKEKPSEILPLKPLSALNTLLITCLSFLAIPIMMAVSTAAAFFFDNNVVAFMDEILNYPIILVVVSAAVLPAVLEEITFRGIILTNFKILNIKKSAVLSGLFFGLMHIDLQQFPYAFLMGIVFAIFTFYTKSIVAPILSHFIINATMVILVYNVGESIGQFPLIPSLIISIPAFFMAFKLFITHNLKNVTNEIPIEKTILKQKIVTWEFIAIFVVYIYSIAVMYTYT